MQKTTISSLIALLLLGSGCSKNDNYSEYPSYQEGNVYIRAYQNGETSVPDFSTKTVIGGESLDKTDWCELDQIMIYYKPAESVEPLSSQLFSFYRPYPDETLFSATMPAQPEANYTYYGAYPSPESIDGTHVTYTLPALQDGSYDMRNYDITDPNTYDSYKGNLDIMIADPQTASALHNGETLGMNFHHQCHVLRIQVPTGRNQWGENVQKLRIEFPTAVVGKMKLDLTDPTAIPMLSEGSNTINVELKEPLTESEEDATNGCYVWVFICPTTVNGTIRFTAYDANGYQSNSLSTTVNKTMAAGAITPITLTVPDELPVTWIDFSITGNNLGETPNTFTVTAPEGATFRNGTNEQTFTVNSSNTYSLGFYNEIDGVNNGDLIKNGITTITYDSEHAVVSEKKQLSFTANGRNSINLTVPYLFYEDFSGLTPSFENSTEFTTSDPTNPDAITLAPYQLTGWTGARIGGLEKSSLRIAAHYESGLGFANKLNGRVDTPPLSQIKAGKTPNINVTFNYGADKYEKVNAGSALPIYDAGYTTNSNAIKGDQDIEHTVISGISVEIDGAKDNTKRYDLSNSHSNSFSVPSCTNNTRLSWKISTNRGGELAGNGNYWLYLDNIRVSIIP